jgi:hypothetical protein
MTVKTKKYLITTRKKEAVTVYPKPSEFRQYCSICKRQVEMITLDAATFETGESTRKLFYLAENNLLHSMETPRGHLLICRNSLENPHKPKLIETEEKK